MTHETKILERVLDYLTGIGDDEKEDIIQAIKMYLKGE